MQLRAWLEEVIQGNDALESRVEALEASAATANHEKAALEGWVRGSVEEQAAASTRLASFQVRTHMHSTCSRPRPASMPLHPLPCVLQLAPGYMLYTGMHAKHASKVLGEAGEHRSHHALCSMCCQRSLGMHRSQSLLQACDLPSHPVCCWQQRPWDQLFLAW